MSRPKGAPRVLASDTKFANVPFTAVDAKLDPGSSIAAAGLYQPDKPLASNFANHRDYHHSRRLLDLDCIEMINWPKTVPEASIDISAGGGNAAIGAAGKPWDLAQPLLFIGNGEAIMVSYDDGVLWASDFASVGSVFRGICESPYATAAIREAGGAGFITIVGPGAATPTSWGSTALTSCTAVRDICWDATEGVFWIVGTHSASCGIWRVPHGLGVVPVTQTTVDTGETPAPFLQVAAGPSWKLAIGDDEFWRWPNASFVPVKQTSPMNVGENARELRYLPEDGLFILCSWDSGDMHVWVSSDASTWTNLSANVPAGFQIGTANQRSAVRGSIFAIPGTLDGHGGILWTGDAGNSWKWQPNPNAHHVAGTDQETTLVHVVNANRWLAAGYFAAGACRYALSLKMGA